MQAITTGVLSAVSDIVAQKLSGIQKLQIKRILLKVDSGVGQILLIGNNRKAETLVEVWIISSMKSTYFRELLLVVDWYTVIEDSQLCTVKNCCKHRKEIVIEKPRIHGEGWGVLGKKDTATVAKKVAVEQLTASPWNNLVFMIDYEMVIDGKSVSAHLRLTTPQSCNPI
ncbi:hypothetical protein D5086_007766 [Populus alba]|uniref:Uncharacterized protein n=1 Tax=Populus alba TaxID=43335 RepID=A0ACC4CDG2_POPAL